MKTLNIKSVFYNFGEVSYTDKNFVGKFIGVSLIDDFILCFDGNKELQVNIKDTRLISNDNFGLIKCKVSEVKDDEILLFDDDENFSIRMHKKYNFFIIRNFENLKKIDDEKIVYSLLCYVENFGYDYSKNILDLLVYSGKSTFKNSLKNQVLDWFNNAIEGKLNKYNRPLSNNQYNGLIKYNPENRKYLNYSY